MLLLAPAAAEPVDWLVSVDVVLPDVEPLADGVDDVLPLADGDVPLLVDGAVPPAALLLVVSEALPEPEDWLVCAPWFMVEDGLVVLALWLADTPALTSLLLMPTFASGAEVEPLGALGCEVLGWLGCAL